jgi:hypothetical protein
MENGMHIVRISNNGDGESFFSEATLDMAQKGHFGRFSALQAAPGILFRESDASYDSGWHVVPNRLYLIILKGSIEITTGAGATRRFAPGSVILAEDTEGAGHRTRAVEGGFTSILVNLASPSPGAADHG